MLLDIVCLRTWHRAYRGRDIVAVRLVRIPLGDVGAHVVMEQLFRGLAGRHDEL